MCGIVGYIGNQNAAPILLEGLSRLEYRGYDSAGIAILGSRGTQVFRRVGRVRDLEASLPRRLAGKIGIGHTRWATHGPPTEENAHPQSSEDGRISVVHNGIIDNAAALRERLDAKGVKFSSETDTEVIAHLIARSEAPTLEGAVLDVLSRITGTYAIAVLDAQHPDRLVVARNGSPLILGVGDREMFVASDLSALVRHTTTVVHLDDGELATVSATEFRTFSQEQENTEKVPTTIDIDLEDVGLGGYRHYMRKEIIEQPSTIERMLRGRLDDRFGTARLDGLNLGPRELRWFRRVKILGCGSAYYVGQIGASMIEELARMPADAEPAIGTHSPQRPRVARSPAFGARHLVEQVAGHDLAEVRAQVPDEVLLGIAVIDEHPASRLGALSANCVRRGRRPPPSGNRVSRSAAGRAVRPGRPGEALCSRRCACGSAHRSPPATPLRRFAAG